jgi:2,3-bisphosphoglycerate-independent phosphoglycerate mutase
MAEYPHAILEASGPYVGLPKGNIGSSEAGHFTIGLGRIIKEPITFINDAIDNKSFFSNPILVNTLKKLPPENTLHLIGLLSDAGVHSDLKQLYAFLEAAKQQGITKVIIHPFLDGRDTPPQSAGQFLQLLEKKIKELGIGKIGSIHGRLYAMDRDNNWNRTEQSYRILTKPHQTIDTSWEQAIEHYYTINTTDEFIPPTPLAKDAYIKDGDGIIFFNFRPDRARQLTAAFVDPDFDNFKKKQIKLSFFITPTVYNTKLKTEALYPTPKDATNSLKDILRQHGKTIFSIAETEKYAHVTYFFDGGREDSASNETRVLIPSLHTKQYVKKPEMSAHAITQKILESLKTDPCDFYLINYANADMVGHSGNFGATIKAIECLDKQLGILYDQIVKNMGGTMYVTADHGNAEDKYDEEAHQPRTAHTTNPVPFIMLRNDLKGKGTEKLPLTQLSNIAPFILKNMNLPIPKEMEQG